LILAKNGTFGAKKAVCFSEQIPTTCSQNNHKKILHSHSFGYLLDEATRNECNILRMSITQLFAFALAVSFADFETLTEINMKYKKSDGRFRLQIKKVITVEPKINCKEPK